MVRNWEIVRKILLSLENADTPNTVVNAKSFSDFPEQEVAYNMRLLDEAGYIEANIMSSSTGDGKINGALALRLTNTGHDLLDTIRNDSIWNKIKEKFTTNGIDMTFDLVVSVGKKVIEATFS